MLIHRYGNKNLALSRKKVKTFNAESEQLNHYKKALWDDE